MYLDRNSIKHVISFCLHLLPLLSLPFLTFYPLISPTDSPLVCLFCLSFSQMSEIKNELETLPLRAMLAAAFITYLSAATEDRRRHCLETWMAQSGLQSKYIILIKWLALAHASFCSNGLEEHITNRNHHMMHCVGTYDTNTTLASCSGQLPDCWFKHLCVKIACLLFVQ